ncbi:hypothetical protein Cs7R123_49210 [Catellatospora sp. TT07R-123]|uniref:hypothetical protein n=1 Tax=Catellatospora sp. TT07R-123 TaxID=2733863 RepID=UPI001B06FACF|nr:hypothetical protein [Catellatospora sp. TT07R-123]GHJ47579.1 hypothetical protein Cs7R123_49210 [Catellatospora sp. TT07R-123]
MSGTFTVAGRHGSYTVQAAEFASGGAASLHATSVPHLVYKRYRAPDKAPRLATLNRLVAFGREAAATWTPARPPTAVPAMINWPVDVAVGSGGVITGVVLPRIPAVFQLPSGKPRSLDHLFLVRTDPPPATTRVGVLFRLAEVLALLDANALVHGDISSKNLVWAHPDGGQPVIYLIDCDGLADRHPPPTSGYFTPGWIDPRLSDRMIKAHDHYSDRYALALAVYRALLLVPGDLSTRKTSAGRWPRPAAIPPQLPPHLATMLYAALNDPLDATLRPEPAAWQQALLRIFNPQALRDLDVYIGRQDKIHAYQRELAETRARQRRAG